MPRASELPQMLGMAPNEENYLQPGCCQLLLGPPLGLVVVFRRCFSFTVMLLSVHNGLLAVEAAHGELQLLCYPGKFNTVHQQLQAYAELLSRAECQ